MVIGIHNDQVLEKSINCLFNFNKVHMIVAVYSGKYNDLGKETTL